MRRGDDGFRAARFANPPCLPRKVGLTFEPVEFAHFFIGARRARFGAGGREFTIGGYPASKIAFDPVGDSVVGRKHAVVRI
jgi:hypothetical protein